MILGSLLKIYLRRPARIIPIFIVILIVIFLVMAPIVVSETLSREFVNRVMERSPVHHILLGEVDVGRVGELIDRVSNMNRGREYTVSLLIFKAYEASIGENILPLEFISIPLEGAPVSLSEYFKGRAISGKYESIISRRLYDLLGANESIDIGSSISITINGMDEPINMTIIGIYEPIQILWVEGGLFGLGVSPWYMGETGINILIHIDLMMDILTGLGESRVGAALLINFRESAFGGLDLNRVMEGIEEGVEEVKGEVGDIFTVMDESGNLLMDLSTYLFFRTFLNMGIYISSIPFFYGVWYLLSVNMEIIISEYRREIAILTARGIPSRKLFNGLVITLIAIALSSLVIGLPISQIWMNMILSMMGLGLWIDILYMLGPDVILPVLIFILGVTLITIYRKRREFNRIPPSEAMHRYERRGEGEIGWRPSKGFYIMLILGILKMAEWILNIDLVRLLEGEWNIIIFILLGIYAALSGILQILAPLFLIYTVVQYASHSRRVIGMLSHASKFFVSRGLRGILPRYISRSPRLVSKSAFISSLMISLMVFSIIYSNRSVAFYNDYLMIKNMGDITINIPNPVNEGLGEAINRIENILYGVEGIESWTYALTIYVSMEGDGLDGESVEVMILVFPSIEALEDFTYLGGGWNIYTSMELDEALREGIILSKKVYDRLAEYGYSLGDELNISIIPGSIRAEPLDIPIKIEMPFHRPSLDEGFTNITSRVTGYFYITPGGYGGLAVFDSLNIDTGITWWTGLLLIIRVMDGYDEGEVLADIAGRIGFIPRAPGLGVREMFMDYPLLSSYSYTLYAILGIIAAIVSIFLVSFQHVKSMIRDALLLRARGYTFSSVASFLYGSSIYLIIFSIILGIFIGFISGYGVSQDNIRGLAGGDIQYPLGIGPVEILIIVAVGIIYLLIPLPAVLRYTRINVVEGLRHVE